MTRTARASFPRALTKDRSESKSGLDKSLRKNGGGYHNWGSLADESSLEAAAIDDEIRELADPTELANVATKTVTEKPNPERRSSSVTEEDRESARQFRKNAFKNGDIDLAAIARTSAGVSTSPPTKVTIIAGAETAVLKSI